MRNLKKLFAVVLVIAVMLTAMVPAFAAGTATDISADAKACATLGMLKGPDANGVTAAYTQTQPSRIQAAIMLLRLKGLEADALKATGDNFSDVKAAWMKPFTAYLKANPSVGFSGIGDNKFDPDSKITAQQYYKVLLTALGYTVKTDANATGDFTWDDTIKFAESKGLTKATKVASFKVEDIAVSTVEALKAKLKDGSKTLTEDLIAKKVFTKDQAISAGIVAAVPTSLTATLTPLNLAELQVVFSDAVNKDSIDITKIKVNGVSLIKDTDKTTLSDDGKTLVVYKKDNGFTKDQSKNVKISIKDIKTAVGGVTMTEIKDQEIRFVDTAIPTITAVKAVGNKKLEVSFSEAINPTINASKIYSSYRIDSKAVSGDSSKAPKVDYKTLTINLSSKLDAGTHKFNFLNNTLKDYAGFAVVPGDIEFTVDNDTSKPTVTVDKVADQSTMYLRFNKEISLDNGSVYWYKGSIKMAADKVEQDSNDKTLYKVSWGSKYLPLTETTIYVDGYSDYFGNKMDKASLTVTAAADTLRPEVKTIEPDPDHGESYMILTFNKDVDIKSVTNVYGAITVRDKENSVIALTSKEYNKDSSKNDIKNQVKIGGSFNAGTYTVVVKGIEDLSAQHDYNKSLEQTFTVTTSDKTAPKWNKLIRIDAEYQLVLVFDSAMDAATVGDINNYQYESKSNEFSNMPAGVDVAVSTSGKVVTMTFPSKIGDDYFTTVFKTGSTGTRVALKNAKDEAGNDLPYTIKNIDPKGGETSEVNTGKVTGKRTIVLGVNPSTEFPVEVNPDDFEVDVDGGGEVDVTGATLDSKKLEITLSLGDDLSSDLQYKDHDITVRVSKDGVSDTKTALGTAITFAKSLTTSTLNDAFAPSLVLDDSDATLETTTNGLIMQFSEKIANIDPDVNAAAASFVVKNEKGEKMKLGEDYTIETNDADRSQVILKLNNTYNGLISVALQNNQFVQDDSKNKADDFDFVPSRSNVSK